MDKVLALLDKKATYQGGVVNGRTVCNVDLDDFSSSDSEDYADVGPYEQDFVQDEHKRYAEANLVNRNIPDDISSVGFSDVEVLEQFSKINPLQVYQKYNFNLNTDIKTELPIDSYREKILNMVESNQVIIIEGPTGCGKTTQVPQYILDSYREKKQYVNIAVTQPRKIATINVAKRVCEERGWTMGTVCGYQVGLERKVAPDVILTYMTTGVLLQKLINKKTLNEFTHIIIDEVHERTQELEFLLLLVRKFLFTNSQRVKVVLMSATINAKDFAHYFRWQTNDETNDAPIIRISKESKYKTSIHYLEHCAPVDPAYHDMIYQFDIIKPCIQPGLWKTFLILINCCDNLDAEYKMNYPGSILVFLPGIYEIEEAHKQLISHVGDRPENAIKWDIIPLHSSLPNDEQAKAFKPAKPGYRKIILSTNIAESSITVPDSIYVIDFCLTKSLRVDSTTKYSCLQLEWASHINCDQRAGRVGRTWHGRVYRLVPVEFYEMEMKKFTVPEILRAPLDRTILQVKMLNLNETPAQVLALSMSPPDLKNIETTIWHLKETGGLLKTCNGVTSNADGDITFLGQTMASLPIDICLSKLIVLGHLFNCLDAAIIIAAGCSVQNIFSIPFQKRLDAYRKLLLWADGSSSDLIALYNLYRVWKHSKRLNHLDTVQKEKHWCNMNLVSLKGLREWDLLITELKARLDRLRIVETTGAEKIHLSNIEAPIMLKVITAGAFYPNFFVKLPQSGQCSEKDAVKILGGRDPYTSVFLTGLEPNQPGQVYVRQIKKLMCDSGDIEKDMKIGFDGSCKIYVEFKNVNRDPIASVSIDGQQKLTSLRGKIPLEVYEAIRKRQLQYRFPLFVMPIEEAWKFAEKHGAPRKDMFRPHNPYCNTDINCFSSVSYNPLPSLDTEYIKINITYQIDAGHFWAQNCSSETDTLLSQISDSLNKQVLHNVCESVENVKTGKLYAARYSEDNQFYRCRVIANIGRLVQILFIDYGNVDHISPQELFELPQRPQCLVAPLAFECVMAGIKPLLRVNPTGLWSEQTNERFRQLTDGILLYARVHSVVDNTVYLYLFRNQNQTESINEFMIKNGLAETAEESFLCKENHRRRMEVLQAENPTVAKAGIEEVVSYADFKAPDIAASSNTIYLKGPFSPLEMKLFGCISTSSSVVVDGTSVNAVMIDSEPDAEYSSLVVAAYVSQSAAGDRLKLRQTTALPSIPGMPMLLALVFCPTMEPKLSHDCTQVVSVLCGLGYNKNTNRPLFSAHDISLPLDTELTVEEIEKINKLRYCMNNGIKTMYEIYREMSSQEELVQIQNQIKSILFDLIHMKRKVIPRTMAKYSKVWNKFGFPDTVVLRPNMDDNLEDIWPLHWFTKLKNMDNDQSIISKNLEDLHDIVYEVKEFAPTSCLLCGVQFDLSVPEIRNHLISKSHKEKVKMYNEELQEEEEN